MNPGRCSIGPSILKYPGKNFRGWLTRSATAPPRYGKSWRPRLIERQKALRVGAFLRPPPHCSRPIDSVLLKIARSVTLIGKVKLRLRLRADVQAVWL